jgi:hypothetical protein
MAIEAGSPAVDAGAVGCPGLDQRGVEREGPCDIGAYEYHSQLVFPQPAKAAIPGGETKFEVLIQTRDSVTESFVLTVGNPNPKLDVSINPPSITKEQIGVIAITNTYTDTLMSPGIWHTLPVTATGTSLSLSGQVQLLVGGVRIFLPMVIK